MHGPRSLLSVRQGAGVGYLSRFSVEADLAAGRLVELLPDVVFPPYAPVYLARADLRLVSPRVAAFERAIRRSAAVRAGPVPRAG
ncbi:MAG: LysR substrate-binding domain-containing protein [Myxococcota bacterium]